MQYALGVFYTTGYGVGKDHEKARKYFELAADKGHSPSQCTLGMFYCKGHTTRDFKKAVHWFGLAANKGNVSAQYNLGILYRHGKGVRQNIEAARYNLELAANQGIAVAQTALASTSNRANDVRTAAI